MTLSETQRARLTAAGLHVLVSALIAACVAVVTLRFWYPGQIGTIAGGTQLFLLILGVDVVMGPLLTLIVFNIRKPRAELVRDLAVIGALQIAALAYGLHTLYVARPVAMVLEPGRLRVVGAHEVRLVELPEARPEYRSLSLSGPLLLGTRPARNGDEKLQSIELALAGYDVGQRPSLWQPYEESRAEAWEKAQPLEALARRYPARRDELVATLASLGVPLEKGRYLPVVARGNWVAVLREGGDIAGYAPFDGF